MFIQNIQYTNYSLSVCASLSLKLTWYQSRASLLKTNFLHKTAVPLFSCNCFQRPPFIMCCLPLWSSELDFQNLQNLIARNLAPHLSLANPPVLISAAASRLLRLSFERHPRFRLVKTKLLQKSRSQKPLHAPPRASSVSGKPAGSDLRHRL